MALRYLISPVIQVEDVNGKPLTGGTIEVFRHGTRIPYITHKDFDGDLNPAKVVLDNKGMCILLADDAGVYDIYCEDRNGVEQWSRLNVRTVAGGGDVSFTSSDGSITITSESSDSGTVYDMKLSEDSPELLEWIRTSGYTSDSADMIPTYADGTMSVGDKGVRLAGDFYYHVTARVKATVSVLQPYYNEFELVFKGYDPDSETSTTYLTRPLVVDGSTGLTQEWEISFDVKPATDVELYATTSGLATGITAGLLDMEIHRVYSGVPRLPEGAATQQWVEDNFTYTAGDGISISEDNVISVTGGGGGGASMDHLVMTFSDPSFDPYQGYLNPNTGIYTRFIKTGWVVNQLSSSPNVWEFYLPSDTVPGFSFGLNDGLFIDPSNLVDVEMELSNTYHEYRGLFTDCTAVKSVTISGNGVLYAGTMFRTCSGLESLTISSQTKLVDITQMCYMCTSLKAVPALSMANWVAGINSAFRGCTAVESGALDLYNVLSTSWSSLEHDRVFENCGSGTVSGAAELAQIPSSWGGTGA